MPNDQSPVNHAESIYAVWHDPTTYDHMRMGPPYLPGPEDQKALGRPKLANNIPDSDSLARVRELIAKEAANEDVANVLAHFLLDYGQHAMAELAALLAFLRAANVLHQTHHWQTRGPQFYGDHLLFDRIYDETLKMIDRLAERTVGVGSPALVNPVIQSTHQLLIIKELYNGAPIEASPDQCALISLKAVLKFLVLQGLVYKVLENKGLLTHGIDNLLQDIADKHEEFVYLLQQRTGAKVSSEASKWPSMIEHDPRLESSLSIHEIKGIVDLLKKGMPPERLLKTHGAVKHKLTQDDLDSFMKMDERGLLKSARDASAWKAK